MFDEQARQVNRDEAMANKQAQPKSKRRRAKNSAENWSEVEVWPEDLDEAWAEIENPSKNDNGDYFVKNIDVPDFRVDAQKNEKKQDPDADTESELSGFLELSRKRRLN